MRALMGLIKDRHGTYYAQRKVPARLQEAVARALGSERDRQVFLKRSLGTKSLKAANVAATHVLAEFDRTFAKAEALLAERPIISSLTDAQIKRMAESHYAAMLASDEEERREGTGSEPLFQSIAQQVRDAGHKVRTSFTVGDLPEAGLSDREIVKRSETLDYQLATATDALARGDVTAIREQADELLEAFQLNIDRTSSSYRKLAMAALTAHVRALKDIERRNAGEPVETPPNVACGSHGVSGVHVSGRLSDACDGWKKERERPEGTVHEYSRAVDMFTQLHGDMRLVDMRRSHARLYREALQLVPRLRKGALLRATLPELSEYGRAHPSIAKVSAATVNKQVGAVQAVAGWGHHHGLIPDEVSWANPFDEMRLEEERSDREPYNVDDLNAIFAHILTVNLPRASGGDAGVWLPLLGAFTGGRLAELGGLRVSDVTEDDGCVLLWIRQDRKVGRRLKTANSERVIPVHPQLVAHGFLDHVAARRKKDGDQAWLFPVVSPHGGRALAAWSKWYGLYIREQVGVTDRRKVFHSFRHAFQDALRRATADEELRDALAGRSSGKSVSRSYGAKSMLGRWGAQVLKQVIDSVEYPGLKLPAKGKKNG